MAFAETALIDWQEFAAARAMLGAGLARILGYFREDGAKSIAAIEEAFRSRNAAALVIPAHTLKGESRQFGAQRLGDLAEHVEMVARRCVEYRESPEELIEEVVALRRCFEETVTALDAEANPLVARRAPGGFGRAQPARFGRA